MEIYGRKILSGKMQSLAWKEEDTTKGIRKSGGSRNLNLKSGCAQCNCTFIIHEVHYAYIILLRLKL
jgi:hypothetical protein